MASAALQKVSVFGVCVVGSKAAGALAPRLSVEVEQQVQEHSLSVCVGMLRLVILTKASSHVFVLGAGAPACGCSTQYSCHSA